MFNWVFSCDKTRMQLKIWKIKRHQSNNCILVNCYLTSVSQMSERRCQRVISPCQDYRQMDVFHFNIVINRKMMDNLDGEINVPILFKDSVFEYVPSGVCVCVYARARVSECVRSTPCMWLCIHVFLFQCSSNE